MSPHALNVVFSVLHFSFHLVQQIVVACPTCLGFTRVRVHNELESRERSGGLPQVLRQHALVPFHYDGFKFPANMPRSARTFIATPGSWCNLGRLFTLALYRVRPNKLMTLTSM